MLKFRCIKYRYRCIKYIYENMHLLVLEFLLDLAKIKKAQCQCLAQGASWWQGAGT